MCIVYQVLELQRWVDKGHVADSSIVESGARFLKSCPKESSFQKLVEESRYVRYWQLSEVALVGSS